MKHFRDYTEKKARRDDETIMEMALQQAEKAKLDGNRAVGAALVWSARKVFDADTTYSEGDKTNHAVMNVLRKASELYNRQLHDAVLYTTVEPCLMCAMAIELHGIKEVVFGAYDNENGYSNFLKEDYSPLSFISKGGVLGKKCCEIMSKEEQLQLRAE